MSRPVLIKADLDFEVDEQLYHYSNQNVSIYGVYGMQWRTLSPQEHFGQPVSVQITVPGEQDGKITVRAYISREQSRYSEHLGLKFEMDDASKAKLQKFIEAKGVFPTEYVRKYPRIPALPSISTFPLRAAATVLYETGERGTTTILLDILNISPNGLLVRSENKNALFVGPGSRVDLLIEPRGEFEHQIQAHGMVCRTMDEIDPKTHNIIRIFGIKLLRLDEINRPLFAELLKNILLRLR